MKYDPYKFLTSKDEVRGFVVIWGNPIEGFNVMGPIRDPAFARAWADRMGLTEGQYWFQYLYHPMD